jgi:GTPase SAR1 family protein
MASYVDPMVFSLGTSFPWIHIVISIFLGILGCIVVTRYASNKPPLTVVFLGPARAGKSTLVSTLITGKFPALPTYTTIACTRTWLTLDQFQRNKSLSNNSPPGKSQKELILVDCPGQARVFLPSIRSILQSKPYPQYFLITLDAMSLRTNEGVRRACEFLIHINDLIQTKSISLGIVTTKADEPIAVPSSSVIPLLRKELELLPMNQIDTLNETIKKTRQTQRKTVASLKYVDLQSQDHSDSQILNFLSELPLFHVSAKTGEGIDTLKNFICKSV